MLTNAHKWAGYNDPTTDMPSYPLRIGAKREFEIGGGTAVVDANGKWMGTFRNAEDAQTFINDGAKRAKEMNAASDRDYMNSKVDDGDNDRTLCRVCLRYFSTGGIGQHTKSKHAMKLSRMLAMRVPTEREFKEFHAAKGRKAA